MLSRRPPNIAIDIATRLTENGLLRPEDIANKDIRQRLELPDDSDSDQSSLHTAIGDEDTFSSLYAS